MATTAERNHILRLWNLFIANEPKIHYSEIRPMATRYLTEAEIKAILKRTNGGLTMDCSETVSLICRLCGLKSPSGPHWPYTSGAGNTQTMGDYLPHYTEPKAARVGAIIQFAYDLPLSFQHVAQVIRRGNTPAKIELGSHGYEGGPVRITLEQEAKYHKGHYRFLSIANL